MEMDNLSCILFNTAQDERRPHTFRDRYHVHILMHGGKLRFSDGKNTFTARKDDLVIWQMSNTISSVSYSADINADVLLGSPTFVSHYNPEMTWATRGYLFIRRHPVFSLKGENLNLIANDFAQLRMRLDSNEQMFKIERLGSQFRMLLLDMWVAYSQSMPRDESDDNASAIFLRFVEEVQKQCRTHRDVAYYADRLCITPKYLSQVSNKVTNVPALQWINYYAGFELISMLQNRSLSLQDIAYQMEFSSPNHFTRYCRKILGTTPSQFRSDMN